MENTPKQEVVQPKEKKQSNSIVGLLVGVVAFLSLLVILGIIFIFTDLGNTLIDKVQEIKNVESVEEETEEENTEVEEVTLKNEGWSLYSIPEYGFSVEIPDTKEDMEFDEYQKSVKTWQVSRIDNFCVDCPNDFWIDNSNLLEVVNFEYAPLWSPEVVDVYIYRMLGIEELQVGIYDKDENTTLDDLIAVKEEQYNDSLSVFPPGSEDYMDSNQWVDHYKYDDQIGDGAWCVTIPNIAGEPFQSCYVLTNNYIFQISYEGNSRIYGEVPDVDSVLERENIINSMKFE